MEKLEVRYFTDIFKGSANSFASSFLSLSRLLKDPNRHF